MSRLPSGVENGSARISRIGTLITRKIGRITRTKRVRGGRASSVIYGPFVAVHGKTRPLASPTTRFWRRHAARDSRSTPCAFFTASAAAVRSRSLSIMRRACDAARSAALVFSPSAVIT